MRNNLFIILMLFLVPAFVVHAEDVSPEVSTTEVIEIDEGVYQVFEEDESTSEYGNDSSSSVDDSSSGYDSGEVVTNESGTGSGDSEGDKESNGDSKETATESNAESENDILEKLEVIDDDIDKVNDSIFKLIISIWVLGGLFMGVKLIKEMFGYG